MGTRPLGLDAVCRLDVAGSRLRRRPGRDPEEDAFSVHLPLHHLRFAVHHYPTRDDTVGLHPGRAREHRLRGRARLLQRLSPGNRATRAPGLRFWARLWGRLRRLGRRFARRVAAGPRRTVRSYVAFRGGAVRGLLRAQFPWTPPRYPRPADRVSGGSGGRDRFQAHSQ